MGARNLRARTWVVPKSVVLGDEIVIYIGGYGFFATARVSSLPSRRLDWNNRYGADLTSIKLIIPPISLTAIQRAIPRLTWANYPRSITTPPARVTVRIRELIRERRATRLPRLDDEALAGANLDELRRVALLRARPTASQYQRTVIGRVRSRAIRLYVLHRANGECEGCSTPGPFRTQGGDLYLEPHHIRRLADDGPDHPAKVVGLCPNCHRRAHHGVDRKEFNRRLLRRVAILERR